MESAWVFFGNVVPRILMTDGTIQGVQKLLGDELGLFGMLRVTFCFTKVGLFWLRSTMHGLLFRVSNLGMDSRSVRSKRGNQLGVIHFCHRFFFQAWFDNSC